MTTGAPGAPALAAPPASPPRARGADVVRLAQRLAPFLLGGYLACIALATLIGLGFDPVLANAKWRLARALGVRLSARDLVDAARNVALFAGWGVTLALVTRPLATRRTVAVATLTGLLASVTVEAAQCFSTRRMASLADVATNTLGACLGAAVVVLVEWRASGDVRRGTLLGVPAWFAAGGLALAALGFAYAPSARPAAVVSWAGSPLGRLADVRATPATAFEWWTFVPDVAVFGALGLVAALAVADRAGRLRLPQLAAWAAIAAAASAGAQLLRGLSGLRRETGAAWVQGVAVAAGLAVGLLAVGAWRRRVPAAPARAGWVAGAIVLVLLVCNWMPAWWLGGATAEPSWRQLVPMYSLYMRQDLGSVFIVAQKAGLGAALGALVAGRRMAGVRQPGLRAVALLAVAVEAGQLLVPGRWPDVTDVLLITAGAAVTAVLALRASEAALPGAAVR